MPGESLDFQTLERVLTRLDDHAIDTKVSCIERLLFVCLTVAVYAIPLLLGAVLVARTFDPVIYEPLVRRLEGLAGYALVAALLLLPLNFRLIQKIWRHERQMRSLDTLRLADYLLGRRGRLEESAEARVLVRHGIPIGLTLVLLTSIVVGLWSGRSGLSLASTLPAAVACIGFFFVQNRTAQLFDHLRRRIDYSREVLSLRALLTQKRQKAAEGLEPVVLNRGLALRLSDLDRMFVLADLAAARVRAQTPGLVGAPVSWDRTASEHAEGLEPADRLLLDAAIQHVSLGAARHWKKAVKDDRALPERLQDSLAAEGFRLAHDNGTLLLSVPRVRGADLTVRLALDAAARAIWVSDLGLPEEPDRPDADRPAR